MTISLLPDNPAAWTYRRWEDLMAIPREEREKLQLEAVRINFSRMRNRVPALKKLADRQGIEDIEKLEDVLPVCFDHRVLKNYPIQIIESRDFSKLTGWLDKLTAHDLTRVDLTGLMTIEEWLGRLEAFGMLVTYSSGTTGKLSFVPRSYDEFGPWKFHFFNVNYASSGVNPWVTKLPTFFPGYRGGYQTMLKMMSLFNVEMAGGENNYYTLYDTGAITSIVGPPLVYWLIATHGWREAWIWLGVGWSVPVLVLVFLFLIDARRIGETKALADPDAAPVAVTGLSVPEAIRSAALWRIGISTLITMLIGTAAVVHQVPILVDAGVTREYAALLASLSGVAAFIGKFVMGWLMDRMHAVRISGVMLALSGIGFALLLEPLRSPAAILVAMVIIGFAGGAKLQITAYLTGRYAGLKNFGKIFGVMHGLTVLGAGTGPFLAGLVYDTTGSYSAILILGIPGSLLCGALIFGLGPYPELPADTQPRAVPAS